MINLFTFALVVTLMINFFLGSISLQGVNRTLIMLPRALFESAVVTFDEEMGDDFYPYFEERYIYEVVEEYFRENLTQYVPSYRYGILFYQEDDLSICRNKCQTVKISLECKIMGIYNYQNAMTYSLLTKEEYYGR